MTVADKLTAIVTAKTAIVQAVNGKGGSLANDPPIASIAPAITALPSGGGGGAWDAVITVQAGSTSTAVVTDPEELILDFDDLSITVGGATNRWPQYWPITGVRGGKNITIGNSAFSSCTALQNVDGLSGVTGSIGISAFYGCTSLTSVDGLSGVTGSIGSSAFSGCSSLTSVDGLTGVTGSIGDRAFSDCKALTRMSIAATSFISPGTTTGQFYRCTNLTEIHLTAPVICTIAGTTNYNGLPASFRDCPAHIIVPDNLLADYTADARWALMRDAERLWSETEWSQR